MSNRPLTREEHAWLYRDGVHAPDFAGYQNSLVVQWWRADDSLMPARYRHDAGRELRRADPRRQIEQRLQQLRGMTAGD